MNRNLTIFQIKPQNITLTSTIQRLKQSAICLERIDGVSINDNSIDDTDPFLDPFALPNIADHHNQRTSHMSKTGEIPYNWPQIEEEIESAILAQASVLNAVGPKCDGKIVKMYLGISDEDYREIDFLTYRGIDITRHQLYDHVKTAYDYSYQLRTFDDPELIHYIWYDVVKLLEGFIQTWIGPYGEPSPFHVWYDYPLRRMLDTFVARYELFNYEEPDLTIRQLSLLANMTIPAVRTSLSKEGFKLKKSAENRSKEDDKQAVVFRLNGDDAKLWLSRRRGFIPQRTGTDEELVQQIVDRILSDRGVEFAQSLARVMELRKIDAQNISGVNPEWLSNLINGKTVTVDVEALLVIAGLLDVPAPEFTAAGIRYILAKEGA